MPATVHSVTFQEVTCPVPVPNEPDKFRIRVEGRSGVETRSRNGSASVFANVDVSADVEITLVMERDGGETAMIHFGRGEDLVLEFTDPDSLDLLAAVAVDGARQLRERLSENRHPGR